jgi:hypothetical protein
VFKILNFLKEATAEGRIIHHLLPVKYQIGTRDSKFSEISPETLFKAEVVRRNPVSEYKMIHKAIEISSIGPGSHFGEAHMFIMGQNEKFVAPAGSDDVSIRKFAVGNETDFIGRIHPSAVTITSTNRLEIASVSKLDFYKFSTMNTWKFVAAQKLQRITIDGVLSSYAQHARWQKHKKKQTEELIESKRLQRQRQVDFRINWMSSLDSK